MRTAPANLVRAVLIASLPFLGACEGPTGPTGPSGADGAPGADGTWSGTGADLIAEIDGAVRGGASFAKLAVTGGVFEPITGVVTTAAGSQAVVGIGTDFLGELRVGEALRIGSEIHSVAAIASADALTLAVPAAANLVGAPAYRDGPLLAVANGLGAPKLTVDGHGAVGVGTSSPAYTLDVQGSFRAGGITTFRKTGNNGTVPCDTYCRGSTWGRTGTCIAARNPTTGDYGTCADVFGAGQGADCACAAFDP